VKVLLSFDVRFFLLQLLPPAVKRRVKALKKLQVESLKIEAKFFEEIHELETKYHELYKPQYTKRASIVKGLYEPNDEECEFEESDDESEDDEELNKEVEEKLNIKDIQAEQEAKYVFIVKYF